jgi:hypothetical protein
MAGSKGAQRATAFGTCSQTPIETTKKPDFNAGLLHFSLAANYFAGVIFVT